MPAARVTAVGAPAAGGALAPVLRTLMIRPQRRCFMPAKAARLSLMAASSLRSISCCHSSSERLSKGPRCEVPALLTSTSILPSPAWAAAKAPRQPSALPTSAATVITLALLPPATSARASSRICCRRATRATLAPAPTKRLAMARPMPRLPPVIRALRPVMLSCIAFPPHRSLLRCQRPRVGQASPSWRWGPDGWAGWRAAPARCRATARGRSFEHLLVDDVVADRMAIEGAQDIAGGLKTHAIERFARDAGHVRRADDVGQLQQGIAGRRRFLLEHVQTRTRELAGRQRLMEGAFIDDAATGRIDEIGGWLQPCQPRRVEHADGLGGLRAMDADEIGAWQGGVELGDRLTARRHDLGRRQIRIIDQHLHFHGLTTFGA